MQAILASVVLSIAGVLTQQGAIASVTPVRTPTGGFWFEIRGTNPCTSVFAEFGDGTSHTYELPGGLPNDKTVWHHYTRGGTYTIRIVGAGGCRGEATTRVTVDLPAEPTPTPTPTPDLPVSSQPSNMRFAEMDSNRDGVVTRQEWRGSDSSFRIHDWNRDGRLDGDEVRLGAMPRGATGAVPRRDVAAITQWTEANFRQMDRNRNNRIERSEWRGEVEDFYRIDDNDDGVLTLNEFLLDDVDDDRGDRLADLDLNRNGRIDRSEWHGSDIVFRRLDRNDDDAIDGQEAVRQAPSGFPIGRGAAQRGGGASRASLDVSARTPWTDTGIDVRAGDTVVIQARGTIRWAPERTMTATPAGGSGAASPSSPVPGAGVGALVARVGDNPAFLATSNGGTIRVTQSGRLFLGVNDDYLNDNQGSFQVTVVRR